MMRVLQVFLVVAVILNTLGFAFVYWKINDLEKHIPLALLETSIQNQDQISAKLDGLQAFLSTNNQLPTTNNNVLGMADLLPDTVGNPQASTPATFVSVAKNINKPVPVYKEQADFSAVLGQLIPEYKYPYYSKIDDWYLVSLTDGKTGWVKAAAVSESPQ